MKQNEINKNNYSLKMLPEIDFFVSISGSFYLSGREAEGILIYGSFFCRSKLFIKSGSLPVCLKNHKAQEIMIRGITPIKDRITYSIRKFVFNLQPFSLQQILETVSNLTKLTLC